jgi:hypothetical protein
VKSVSHFDNFIKWTILIVNTVAAHFNISHFINRYDVKIHFAEPNNIFKVVKYSRGFLVHNKL